MVLFLCVISFDSFSVAAHSARQAPASPQENSAQTPSNQQPPSLTKPASVASPSPAQSRSDSPLLEAIALYRRGDFAGAIAKYEEVLQQHAKSPDAWAGIVRCYLKQKDVEHAAQAAEKGLAESDSAQVRAAHAEVLFRQGRIAEAESEWVKIINSGYPEARAYLGVARVRDAIAMYKSERALLNKAHELNPNDPDIQDAWVGTLSRAERIKYLQDMLAGENNWSADEREDARNYLEFLTARTKQKSSPCRLVSNVSTTETPLLRLLRDPEHLRGYGLPVVFNGHKSSLMLDTGASGIVIKRGLAEKAGISKVSSTKILGIGNKGRRNAFIGVADSIRIGELEFQDCLVEVTESHSVGDEDGLVGADIFSDFLVEIDFPNEKLKLNQLPRRPGEGVQKPSLKEEDDDSDEGGAADTEKDVNSAGANTASKTAAPAPAGSGPQHRYIAPEMQNYTRVYRFGHDLLVPTSIGNVPQKLFLLDTGSTTNFISPAAAREVTKVHDEGDVIVKGISGRVDQVFTANKATLQFGRLRQENQDMTAFDTKPISDGIGTEVSGFLGFTTLRFLDIKIDYRDALVDFEYDRNRRH